MSEVRKIRRALLSVYDKTGLVEFARALHEEFGIELISTGGTAKVLKDAGLPVTLVEEVTGFPEMLDGRVKTLHPKIHAAILADRDNPEHMRQLAAQGIEPIDMVVVNLYPFEQTIAKPGTKRSEQIEMIDIGGPCLLRAAAKNHNSVVVVNDPEWYEETLREMRVSAGAVPYFQRFVNAIGTFEGTARYDLVIYRYWSQFCAWAMAKRARERGEEPSASPPPATAVLTLDRLDVTRYGENPHQEGSVWRTKDAVGLDHRQYEPTGEAAILRSRNIDGLDFSYNNFADASASLDLCAELTRAAQGKMWHRLSAGESREWQPVYDDTATRRNLPHLQRPGATYFVTFRLRTGALSPAERDILMECVLYPDGRSVALHAAVVLPDHVHLLMTPRESAPGACYSLGHILQGIKGVSARRINQARGGSGSLWLDESWDRIIRDDEEFWKTMDYIHENSTRAGLDEGGPYPWCVFETEASWNHAAGGAFAGAQHTLYVGQVIEGQSPEPRNWQRLVTRSTTYEEGHRLIAGATKTLPAVCFIKHTNACGTAMHADPLEAYRRAYLGDPNAAMGGVLAVNFGVGATFAESVMETYARWGKSAGAGGFFLEVWLAPTFEDDAVQLIRTKKDWGSRVRLLAVGDMSTPPDPNEMDFKRIAGGMLMQTRDLVGLNEDQWKVVTQRQPSEIELDDLRLAWLVCKHTKSNAITICRDGMLIGNGAGQMSRVMSCRIATWLAQENGHADALKGAVAASDAFFPFRDGPEILMNAGVTALIQPGGSKRDVEVIEACNARGAAMIFTGTRHFKH